MSGPPPILVIGHTGQLAQALSRSDHPVINLDRADLDLASDALTLEQTLSNAIAKHNPVGVINAAAYTHVDKAESEYDVALAVNGAAPGVTAQFCARHGLPLVHISTDYVFSGQAKTPYREGHPTAPINAYGRSKLVGEAEVSKVGGQFAILRTSWVYDRHGRNFLTIMLRLAQSESPISVVDDQIGRPTYAPDLADAAIAALDGVQTDPSKSGLYHVSNSGPPISWAEFAKAIFEHGHINKIVRPIPSSDYPTVAQRPTYSVLNIDHFEKSFDLSMPHWQDGLDRAMALHVSRFQIVSCE